MICAAVLLPFSTIPAATASLALSASVESVRTRAFAFSIASNSLLGVTIWSDADGSASTHGAPRSPMSRYVVYFMDAPSSEDPCIRTAKHMNSSYCSYCVYFHTPERERRSSLRGYGDGGKCPKPRPGDCLPG